MIHHHDGASVHQQALTPGVSPLFSPSGLIYRYVLVSPDHTPQELKTLEQWVLERRYRAIPGFVSMLIVLSIFAASFLLIPLIGAEFMPHLDEGALWMRATAPYTISFDEASRLSPQIRNILRSFPQVTTVANELGRPDGSGA